MSTEAGPRVQACDGTRGMEASSTNCYPPLPTLGSCLPTAQRCPVWGSPTDISALDLISECVMPAHPAGGVTWGIQKVQASCVISSKRNGDRGLHQMTQSGWRPRE